jgi:hypothetical protein
MRMDEMAGACGMCGGGTVTFKVWWGNLREREHLEDQSNDGGIFI